MNLFPDESIVSESDNGEIKLTTHRIYQRTGSLSSSQTKSIMLEHITSCQSNFHSNKVVLAIGVLFVLLPFLLGEGSSASLVFLLIGLILVVLYTRSRKNEIIISSPSASITIDTVGLSRKAVDDFINKIEDTKHKRMVRLSKG